MENLNIRKRVFENLGDLHYTADVYKIFGDEQKKYRRQFKKFWQRLQKDKQLINELLFRRQLHTKLSGPTYKTLVYAFAKAYHERTDVQVLKEYTSALMGRYEYGYDCFAKIIRQKELALINYIIDGIRVTDICNDKRTQVFMRQAMTLLILTSDMKYDKETELAIDHLLDEFKEGRAQM
ncbi:MAG: hypothetical protein V8R25_00590 [Alphaproteobacteria bacterium]